MRKMSMRQPEFIEAKEMVRDAKTQPSTTASVSSYKSLRKTKKKPNGKKTCNLCSKTNYKFSWSIKDKKYIECSTYKQCLIKSRKKNYQSMLMRQMSFWLVDHIHKILIRQLMFMRVSMSSNLILTSLIIWVGEMNQYHWNILTKRLLLI